MCVYLWAELQRPRACTASTVADDERLFLPTTPIYIPANNAVEF